MQLGDKVRLKKAPDKDLDFLIGRIGTVVEVYPVDCFDIEFRTENGEEPLTIMCVTRDDVERVE